MSVFGKWMEKSVLRELSNGIKLFEMKFIKQLRSNIVLRHPVNVLNVWIYSTLKIEAN